MNNITMKYINKLIFVVGKKLHLDAFYFFKNGTIVTLAQLLEIFLSLLTLLIFARLGSKSDLGTYTLILSVVSLASITSLPGTSYAVTRFISHHPTGLISPFLNESIKYSFLGSIFIFMSALFFFIIKHNFIIFITLTCAATIFPLLYSFNNCVGGYWIGKKNILANSFCSILIAVLTNLALICTMLITTSPIILFISFATSSIIPNVIIFLYITYQHHPESDYPPTEDIAYAKFLTKSNIINNIATYFEQIIIGVFLSPLHTANFRIASSLTNTVKNFEKGIGGIIFPKFLDHDEKLFVGSHKTKTLILLICSGLLIIVLLGLQPFYIKVMFGAKYLDIINLAQIMLISILFVPIEIYYYNLFMAFKKKVQFIKSTTIIPIIKIVSILTFFYFWGLLGIALGNLIYRIFSLIIYIYVAQKN